jgi:hypothetical protein
MESVGIFYGHLEYFTAFWYILCSFGDFVIIWYIFHRFGALCLATLAGKRSVSRQKLMAF